MQQILWAEITTKAAIGIVLLLVPLSALALAGIQKPDAGLWPRLVGALTLAVAASIWIGLQYPATRGSIGPAALIPINLFSAAVVIATLVLGTAAATRRGKFILVVGAIALVTLAFLEIAHA